MTPPDPGTVLLDTRFDAAPMLSVIVPVYATARYVTACLDSVISAGRAGIELVIVDDSSPDDAAATVQAWLARNPAGALVTRPNGGLSAARNTGMLHARGRYLTFLDSDDLFDGATYRHMLAAAEAQAADLVIAHAVCMDERDQRVSGFPDWAAWAAVMQGAMLRCVTLAAEPQLLSLEASATTRIYRANFARGIGLAFREGLHFEDLPVHVRCLARAQRICLLDETGLYYRVGRHGQITAARGAMRLDSVIAATLAIEEAQEARLHGEAAARLAGAVARSLFWCAGHVARAERRHFFAAASMAMRRAPVAWPIAYGMHHAADDTERLAVLALARGDVPLLLTLADGRPPGLWQLAVRAWRPGMRRLFARRCRQVAAACRHAIAALTHGLARC